MTTEKSMRLFFKGVKIDERTDSYIRKRLSTIEKILDKILRVEVEIDLDKKGKFRVEVMVKTPYSLYRAEETTQSIEGSVDIVAGELKNQIRKDLERVKTLRKRGQRSIKNKMSLDEESGF